MVETDESLPVTKTSQAEEGHGKRRTHPDYPEEAGAE
jgi:hypothetical protein